MLAYYARMRDLGDRMGHGVARWDSERQIFTGAVEFPEGRNLSLRGHSVKVRSEGRDWFYSGFAHATVRVPADRESILNPRAYQAFTCLQQGTQWDDQNPHLDIGMDGRLVWGWKQDTGTVSFSQWEQLVSRKLVKTADWPWLITDVETGKAVRIHSGHLAWNEYRQRWVVLFNEAYGRSFLGEVWYAESNSPLGPWSPARRVVTHDSYSFYNVKQHPYFARGCYIYFEGTYTRVFSASKNHTPRYDYNQVMYRLDLEHPDMAFAAD